MQPLQPEQATFLLETGLRALNNEHRITRKVIEAIPLDKGDYRPDEISKTALDVAWHLAGAEMFFLDSIVAGEFNPPRGGRPDSMRTSADIASWYAKAFEERVARLAQLSTAQLLKVVDFRGMFQLPAVMFIQLSMNHAIHHRGQLSTYFRAMGAKVPSIYGESYDDAQARKAAQGGAA